MTDPDTLLAEAAAHVASQDDDLVLIEARDLLEVEQARARLGDRLAVGRHLVLGLPGGAVTGAVVAAGPALVVVDDGRRAHVVPLAGVLWVRGAGPGLAPERGGVVETLGAALRPWVGEPVEVRGEGSHPRRGILRLVGADHLDLVEDSGAVTIPFGALRCVSARSRRDAAPRTLASRRTCA